MEPLYLTGIIILFGLVAIVILEIVGFLFPGKVATISVFAEKMNLRNPLFAIVLALIFGLLLGHWFIPPDCVSN